MIAYNCDLCEESANPRMVANVDGREVDLCRKCYDKTVGKLVGKGRYVWNHVPYVQFDFNPQPLQITYTNTVPALPGFTTITAEST